MDMIIFFVGFLLFASGIITLIFNAVKKKSKKKNALVILYETLSGTREDPYILADYIDIL